MKKKRVVYLILLVLIIGLVGCSSSDEEVTLTIWHYYNGPQKLALDEYVQEFNETVGLEENIYVEAYSKGDINQLEEMIIKSVEDGLDESEFPDMLTAYSETAFFLDQRGAISDLGNYLTDEELEEYLESYIEEGRLGLDEEFKIFPTAKATEVLMLNKTDWDEFSEASGASLEDLETWEGLAKTAELYYNWTDSLTEGEDAGRAFFGRDSLANYMLVGSKQLEEEIFQLEDHGVVVNLDYDATKRLWDNYYLPYIKGHYTSYGKFSSDDAKVGKIIALVGSTSGAAYFPEEVTLEDNGSYPIESMTLAVPNFEDTEKMAVQQGAGIVVMSSEKKRERAAVEFLKWFTEEDRNSKFSTKTGYLPVKKSAYDVDKFKRDFIEKEEIELAKKLQDTIPLAMEQMTEYQPYYGKAFEQAFKARLVLSSKLDEKSKEDRGKILELLDQGLGYEEAVARFTGEENYRQWFLELEEEIKKVVSYEE